MHITTKRLLIREFEFKDWKAVYEYTSDMNVMKYIPEGVFTEEDAKAFVKKNKGDNAEKFPVILKDEDFLIGHIVFISILVNIHMRLGGCLIRIIKIEDMLLKQHKRSWNMDLKK